MAETKKGKKFDRIAGYTRVDGTKVKAHDRSNPRTSNGVAPKKRWPSLRLRCSILRALRARARLTGFAQRCDQIARSRPPLRDWPSRLL